MKRKSAILRMKWDRTTLTVEKGEKNHCKKLKAWKMFASAPMTSQGCSLSIHLKFIMKLLQLEQKTTGASLSAKSDEEIKIFFSLCTPSFHY